MSVAALSVVVLLDHFEGAASEAYPERAVLSVLLIASPIRNSALGKVEKTNTGVDLREVTVSSSLIEWWVCVANISTRRTARRDTRQTRDRQSWSS